MKRSIHTQNFEDSPKFEDLYLVLVSHVRPELGEKKFNSRSRGDLGCPPTVVVLVDAVGMLESWNQGVRTGYGWELDDTDSKHDCIRECVTGYRGGEYCRVGWIG